MTATKAPVRNCFDLGEARSRAYSAEDVPRQYREFALRALDLVQFGIRDQARAASSVEWLLRTRDDKRGTLAARVITTGSEAYGEAFSKLVRTANIHTLSPSEQQTISRALQLGSDGLGGYAVPFQLDPTIVLTSNGALNPLRMISRVVQVTGKEWDAVTSAGVTAVRGLESSFTESTDGSPTLAQGGAIRTNPVNAFVPFSDELDLSWSGLSAQMTALMTDAKDVEEATSFVTGAGTGLTPGGVVGTLGTASQVTGGGTALSIETFDAAVPARFRPQACYMANRAVYNKLRDNMGALGVDDSYIGPAFPNGSQDVLGLTGGAQMLGRFYGRPAVESDAMDSTIASGKKFLLLGDFQQFCIVDRIGMQVEPVQNVFGTTNNLPTGQRGVYAVWANNSAILVQSAFRLMTE